MTTPDTTTPTAATLSPVLAEHLRAVNAFDLDAIIATFAEDALVNDARREFWGIEAIRAWVAKEMVGDKVTLEATEVLNHHDQTLVRARYDGEYDKTNLPDELIMTNYFTVRDGKITSLFIIRNQDA
jgi:ketosteroid isomerase-like protein